MIKKHKITVIGAGPAGIGASAVLKDKALVLEKKNGPGGLSSSITIDGAVFDFGGHSFHTPHPEVRKLVFNALEMYEQKRNAQCFVQDEFIPYPFQQNFNQLSDSSIVDSCTNGLKQAGAAKDASSFEDFIEQRFGSGISEHFMLPYNRKLWGRNLRKLAVKWTGERVAPPNGTPEKPVNIKGNRKPLQSDQQVAYPAKGGFGEIFKALANTIEPGFYGQNVVSIHPKQKILLTNNGQTFRWHKLISTLPVPFLLRLIEDTPECLIKKAQQLEALSLKLGFIVIGHPVDTDIQRIYSAEPHIAAHKIAINHNSSGYLRNLPHHGIMMEISTGPDKILPRADLKQWITENLLELNLIQNVSEIRSITLREINHAYPVPTSSRDGIIDEIKNWLEPLGIYPLGRFGEWAYINSDEALYRGIQLAKKLI